MNKIKKITIKSLTILLSTNFLAMALWGCGDKGMDARTLFADNTDITTTVNSVTFDKPVTAKLFSEYEATEGFAVSYTVKGDDPTCNWICSGGLYIEREGIENDFNDDGNVDTLWHNIVVYQSPKQSVKDAFACIHIIENGPFARLTHNEGAEFKTTLPFSIAYYPINVLIVYYQEAYYIMLDKTYKVKLTVDTDFEQMDKVQYFKEFFAPGTRKIGFRSTNAETTFSNINVYFGNDAALKQIKKMKLGGDL